jgi:cobalt-zinc-cadmium efflux system outer membrane protein
MSACRLSSTITSLIISIIPLIAGCATFHAQPISALETASSFEARTLDNTDLKKFIEANLHRAVTPWPPKSWDLTMLTFAAFYYHPELDIARAEWDVAKAKVITAGEIPNPGTGFVPEYAFNSPTGVSPWILGLKFDIPVETAGKRGYRIAQAKHLSEAARLNIETVAWHVRSRLRTCLLNFYTSIQTEKILEKQIAIQEDIVKLLEERLAYGEISLPELTIERISLDKTRTILNGTQKQIAENRVRIAEALGLPVEAFAGTDIAFNLLEKLPENLPSRDIRRQALLNRSDILSALSEYEASQSALQLEIAKQYPDIHLGPGYEFDQEENKWSLGFSVQLPVFNRNEGLIKEAKARREESAAEFIALQARVIGEIDRESAGYHEALKKLQAADEMLLTQKGQTQTIKEQFDLGEKDRLALKNAEIEMFSNELLRLESFALLQQSLGRLEDAVQQPLTSIETFPASPEINQKTGEKIRR